MIWHIEGRKRFFFEKKKQKTFFQKGFTLIEMIVVMAILATSAVILLQLGPQKRPALQVREAASTVSQTLRLGRSRAIAADRAVTVALDLATHALTLDGTKRATLAASLQLAANPVAGRTALFVFAPDGSLRQTIAVDWLTGRVGVNAR